ncbi:LemA family [Ureaplasma urealyticum serovar 13 str. ATCC 33698]|uniref:LemA family protein n=1 Tax=Ureaplasma urealyticum TaxID=2130 RepID=UPI0001721F15|nr:LemA family protein [Ureaplasma urealyticum]EDT49302.1 LemA family [Ureaplasma urealyticum serovar 13 str. ATCC 33698]
MDLWKEQDPSGISPNVSNERKIVTASSGEKALYIFIVILSIITIIGWIFLLIWWFKTKNHLIQTKNSVNEASSSIQVAQTKRFDLLNKMIEQTKSYYKFEQKVLDEITKNRSVQMSSDINKNEEVLSKLQNLVNVQFERYPDLKSSNILMELMSTSSYLENEIASSRRAYNSRATDWNIMIFQFMTVIVAAKLKLDTFPIYAASKQERADVSMKSLSDF